MAIDTNIGITYNENYPVLGVDQSSQGFRDNFLVLKRAIENLQSATSSSSSIFSIASSIGSGGDVRVTVGFKDNAFILPTGNPNTSTVAGMLRHTSGVPQAYDGTGWRTVLTTDALGGVTVPSSSYLKLPTGNTQNRPTAPADGMIRYNTTLGVVEVFRLGDWTNVASGSGGGIGTDTVAGVLHLLTDATDPDNAVNLRSLRSFVSSMLRPVSKGISATFNQATNAAVFTAQPFDITLQGQVTGTGTVSNLNDVVIQTTIPSMLTLQQVRDEVGNFVRGTVRQGNSSQTTETGITVNYDSTNNVLELGVREFDINLIGDITGTGHSSKLNNVTITTTATNMLRGLSVFDESVALGAPQTVTALNFVGNGISAAQTGNSVTVSVIAGLSRQDVRNEVGGFIQGTTRDQFSNTTTETGILVNYDATNNTLELGVREFDITLTGAVTGTGHSSKLNNVVINTTTDLIKGLTVFDEGLPLGLPQAVQQINFSGMGVTSTLNGNALTVVVPQGLTQQDVRDTVGAFVTGTIRDPSDLGVTESGIFVHYDSANNRLEVVPRDFTVTLTGAVTGSAVISRLANVTINTITDSIRGMTIFDEGSQIGGDQSVRKMNFVGNAIQVLQNGDVATVTVNSGLSTGDVRDVVGGLIRGTTRVANAQTVTETGITVNYDATNNALELGVKDFTIGLTGAVNGSVLISRLGNTVMTTTTSLVRGLRFYDKGSATGLPQTVQEVNFVGNGVSISQIGNTATVSLADGLSIQNVRDSIGSVVQGANGIITTYNSSNQSVTVTPNDFRISLTGDVTGSAVVSKLGNVTISTVTSAIDGLRAYDEGSALGAPESVQEIDFVGAGISATQTGNKVTVNVPQGLTSGDVRNTVGSFVVGTQRTGPNTVTESGITTFYDSTNNVLELGVRDFTVTLAGAVTGSATISRLNNATITTSTSLIQGLRFYDEGSATGLPQTVQEVNFVGNGIAVTQVGNTATVTVNQTLSLQNVRDSIGAVVQGANGIISTYNAGNQSLVLTPKAFNITLAGAVTGNATVTNLGNVIITTSSPAIAGLRVFDEGSALGDTQSVQEFDFVGNAITATQTGNRVTVSIAQGLTSGDVRNTVGSFVTGTQRTGPNTVTESGITTFYDSTNNTLELGVRDFTVALTGAVTGSTTISRLNNATITTTTSLIQGLRFYDEGSAVGLPQTVQEVNFVGNGIVVSQTGNTATVTVNQTLNLQNVADAVGTIVQGSNGIATTYNSSNKSLTISPNNFNINLTGPITGTATVTNLGNVTIATNAGSLISGITVNDEGNSIGGTGAITTLNFTGTGVTAQRFGAAVVVTIPGSLTTGDVRNTVGSFIQGTVRDPSTQVSTESGIYVNYDSQNNVLELAPREFTIALTGAVQGTGTVTHLNNVSITTTSDFLTGLSVSKDGTLLGSAVRKLNFTGGNAVVSGDTATFSLVSQVNTNAITTTVNNLIVGTRHAGITATYDASNAEIDLALKPITIRLLGAVTGNGTVNYTGNSSTDGQVTINTAVDSVGIEVRDEGANAGTVKTVNFVGGGVTTTVSIDGSVATVYVPNSPANEKFLLIDDGSANVPNARRFTAGSGILLDDGGPGGAFTISASSDSLVAKSRIMFDGALVGERAQINILSANEIIPEVVDHPDTNEITLKFYGLNEGWYRPNSIDCGLITDKYGPSIDLGSLQLGIIETDADMGVM